VNARRQRLNPAAAGLVALIHEAPGRNVGTVSHLQLRCRP